MLKDIVEGVAKLWSSWSLLAGATLVGDFLWFAPSVLLLDPAVSRIFTEYRGWIGVGALVLTTVTVVRSIISVVGYAGQAISTMRVKRAASRRVFEEQARAIRQLPYLQAYERDFLRERVERRQQRFRVEKSNQYNWVGQFADVVLAEIGLPYTEYKIKEHVWKHLLANPSLLSSATKVDA